MKISASATILLALFGTSFAEKRYLKKDTKKDGKGGKGEMVSKGGKGGKGAKKGSSPVIQLGPRPYYLVNSMDESDLKTQLRKYQ